ncbi:MAG: ABC transporter ATP-binding protein [Lachnospiraceae bacterium]|nr:ABC transporter ATP-binding protein [Lachnospiraceae bacterium]
MTTPILECHNLTKCYDHAGKVGLKNVELTLGRGKIIGLLGPNGSGKTTLIKLITGLLMPQSGELYVAGYHVGPLSKRVVSYLPELTYLNMNQKVKHLFDYFEDFYPDFRRERAENMLGRLGISPEERLKTMSKGTKEKVQLILVMSRDAEFYVLDEPIAGVDPAARDYILETILSNRNPESSVLLSTHLIHDIEPVLDEVVMIKEGQIQLVSTVEGIKERYGCSVDEMFREVFKC